MCRFLQTLLWLAVLTLERPAAAARLEITIEPVFQGAPLRLDSPAYQNAAGETLSVTRLSYLLSGFALERTDGQWVEFPATHGWLDAAARRKVISLPDAPDATYRAIRQGLFSGEVTLLEPYYRFAIQTVPSLAGRLQTELSRLGASFVR